MKKISLVIMSLAVLVSMSGCEYHFGGAKIFDATASTEEGKNFVKKNNVKYICKNVYGVLWSDFYRSDGVYAINLIKTKEGKIQYKSIKKDWVDRLGLLPKYTWW